MCTSSEDLGSTKKGQHTEYDDTLLNYRTGSKFFGKRPQEIGKKKTEVLGSVR